MSYLTSNEKGVTLIESVLAILLVSIGLLGLLSMQPASWRASARADHLGHAAMILNQELTRQELWIMNPCNTVTAGSTGQTVYSSGQGSALAGDLSFTVQTTTTNIDTNTWRVTIRVSWPLNSTGIAESVVVTRQEPFRAGCT